MKILIDMNLSPMWVSFLADSGFVSIHWSRLGHPSSAQDILPAAIGGVVLHALRASGAQLAAGALVTVDPQRERIRLLPL